MQQIEQDIKDAVAKHLPQAVGDVLQERLKKADADAVKVGQLNDKLTQEQERYQRLSQEKIELEAKLNNHIALDKREEAVAARERAAEVEALKVQLQAANGNTKFAQDVALGLVRNVEYRNTVHNTVRTSDPIVPPGSTYQAGIANGTKDETTTTTKEAT